MAYSALAFLSKNFSYSRVLVCKTLRERCLCNGVISNNNKAISVRARSYPVLSCARRFVHTSCWSATRLADKPRDRKIKSKEIFLIDENGAKIGNTELQNALVLAKEKRLHVVQIRDKMKEQHIPVCKLMSLETIHAVRESGIKQKSHDPDVKRKEMKFSSEITDHDLTHKLRNMGKLLSKGCHVKIIVTSNNPGKAKQQDRIDMLKKITSLIAEHGVFDGKIRPGKNMVSGEVKPVEKSN